MSEVLLEVKNLKKHFPIRKGFIRRTAGYVRAVDGIDLTVYAGETLGVVGESGCGKSTMGRSLLRLVEPTSGQIHFQGKDIMKLSKSQMRDMRREMQIVFQDPYASLNPRYTIGQTLSEPMEIHHLHNSTARKQRVQSMLERVGLDPSYSSRFPHEFSGGQRQRIGIARALVLNPKLMILDEPVAALDVSVQSQVINLLEDLQQDFNLTYIFVAHDLSVVKHISNRILVMYLGRMMELASSNDLFADPLHPYTRALLSAVPIPNPRVKRERIILQGDLPSPANPPKGCVFHTRCPLAQDVCREKVPEWREAKHNHMVACHLV
ncbi:ABC transporter ATP-binding protein [Alicyclobacillus tolerans]|uniref:Oligopeptide transport system ATP-binding protein n=2 Tax=Alicyclobacillus tolerans TaxID=90970 RepID=A0A1M6WAN2_9BACL|nr:MULTISPECIES: dipeptide ABC transporter ATP-binding protein [Alicyclobacillus]MDP9729075.1 oligopeptide/dipeptide ABC transporter ATP-binding protein [Alicyclobacillus tengchongensis]QRF24175.1 dipeptide ABC transporter ATP-binding protein [Alicyclobacillus sp. TC]SHK90689.1 oligopeptide transport system ATP-binding protein [Alicyclobacillus montanus]